MLTSMKETKVEDRMGEDYDNNVCMVDEDYYMDNNGITHMDDHTDRVDNIGGMNDPSSSKQPWPRTYKEATDFVSNNAASPSKLYEYDLNSKTPLLSTHDKIPVHSSTPLEERATNNCTVAQTVSNGFSVFVGIGLLSVPSTIQEAGWGSIVLLILYASLCYYTAYLLRRCFETNEKITRFPELGEAAFGNKNFGHAFVSTVFYFEMYFCCVEFIMLEADNLAKLFPNASLHWGALYLTPVHFFGIIATLTVLPTCYIRDLRKISYISACGVIGALCIALSLLSVGVVENIGFHQTGPLVKWNGLPYALGVFGYCYSGHSVLPNLYQGMSKKENFNKALTIIFLLSTTLYLVVAITGFLMFGEDTNSEITLNLPANAAASTIALFITVINPLFKYSMLLNPLAKSVEEFLPEERANSYWYIIPLRTTLVVSTVLVAFLVPFFGYVMAFAGTLMCLLASIVIPALCYVKIVKNLSSFEVILCYIVAVIGLIVALFSTYASVYNIIQQYYSLPVNKATLSWLST